MARATSKADLINMSQVNFKKLSELITSMTKKELSTTFDFSCDEKKKEAHWKRDKNLRDVLIHLYEWHKLILNWVTSNMKGMKTPFLPKPYNWKTYVDMNIEFWEKHQNTTLEDANKMYIQSHNDVMELAERFTDKELFSKDVFSWVGGSTLGSYFVSATASHYVWAIKKLKAHRKKCKEI